MRTFVQFIISLTATVLLGGCMGSRGAITGSPERRAVNFLQIEVPAWSRDNHCYSCHNNGDAARALLVAGENGLQIPPKALADTVAWLKEPGGWDHNKGDPGFSDKHLADVQFGAALVLAVKAGYILDSNALPIAARRIADGQSADGSWPIGTVKTLGSPATYGETLATHMALQTLKAAALPEQAEHISRSETWLRNARILNTPDAAAVLLALKDATDASALTQLAFARQFLERARSSDGGWGPYPASPTEVFDTSLALLALTAQRDATTHAAELTTGREYLLRWQNADGSWPETTRPSGNESYAQRLSTTGWATLALLATQPR